MLPLDVVEQCYKYRSWRLLCGIHTRSLSKRSIPCYCSIYSRSQAANNRLQPATCDLRHVTYMLRPETCNLQPGATMPAIVETRNLTRRYGDTLALDHLNLQIPDGAIFGFIGPNGAGKTTTMRILTT